MRDEVRSNSMQVSTPCFPWLEQNIYSPKGGDNLTISNDCQKSDTHIRDQKTIPLEPWSEQQTTSTRVSNPIYTASIGPVLEEICGDEMGWRHTVPGIRSPRSGLAPGAKNQASPAAPSNAETLVTSSLSAFISPRPIDGLRAFACVCLSAQDASSAAQANQKWTSWSRCARGAFSISISVLHLNSN